MRGWKLVPSSIHFVCVFNDVALPFVDGVEQTPDLELPDEVMKSLQEEAVVMSRMRHPHLVSFMVRP